MVGGGRLLWQDAKARVMIRLKIALRMRGPQIGQGAFAPRARKGNRWRAVRGSSLREARTAQNQGTHLVTMERILSRRPTREILDLNAEDLSSKPKRNRHRELHASKDRRHIPNSVRPNSVHRRHSIRARRNNRDRHNLLARHVHRSSRRARHRRRVRLVRRLHALPRREHPSRGRTKPRP